MKGQFVDPGPDELWLGHCAHPIAPASEYVPAGHTLHGVEGSTSPSEVPVAHSVQLEAPAGA